MKAYAVAGTAARGSVFNFKTLPTKRMRNLVTALATGICFAFQGYAQQVEELYREDFNDSTYNKQILHSELKGYGAVEAFPYSHPEVFENSKYLQFMALNPRFLTPEDTDENELQFRGNRVKLSDFDSLEVEFLIYLPTILNMNVKLPIQKSYASTNTMMSRIEFKDAIGSGSFEAEVIGMFKTWYNFPESAIVSYDTVSKKMSLKWTRDRYPESVTGSSNYLPLLTTKMQRSVSTATISSASPRNCGPEPQSPIAACLCGSANGNCVNEMNEQVWFKDWGLRFAIDDLVVKGSTLVTSLERDAHAEHAAKKIVKAIDFLGKEIEALDSYHGAAIVLYGDGTRRKIVK